jgi:hypothetical protein
VSPQARSSVLQALWPAGARAGIWGILDAARDPGIYRALLDSRLEFRCLYAGKLPRELEMNAPQLVELSPTSRLMERWLDEGWGQAWGVLLRIDDPSNLRHHLRKFLKVRDEQGRSLLFRYYDPRVLRVYLPTCTAAELAQLFGPVEAWVLETPDGTSLAEYRFNGERLSVRELV